MPPIGTDERAYALHVLSVVRAAKQLAAAVARTGTLVPSADVAIRTELEECLVAVGKLVVYENRAGVRGTIRPMSDQTLMEAVDALRSKKDLTLEQEDVLATTAEDAADLFRLEAEPADVGADFTLEEP